ncbi:hypothetical protein GCM10025870_27400 [Agromyces marinus]|uniref:Luciferase-like domain-containing protein n=1 Tax=Agromyces marinus TaxID=1389020 RepID=A0ABN6YIB9_9MICO|nr:hypothetical protein GCM10025870_27400 [Agromyces marinus]
MGVALAAGRARRAPELGELDVFASPALAISDRPELVEAALAAVKPNLALYVGGMGARGKNFYNDLIAGYGFAAEAERIQDLYLDGRREEAVAAVPDDLVRAISLIGSPSEVAGRVEEFARAGVTTLNATPSGAMRANGSRSCRGCVASSADRCKPPFSGACRVRFADVRSVNRTSQCGKGTPGEEPPHRGHRGSGTSSSPAAVPRSPSWPSRRTGE